MRLEQSTVASRYAYVNGFRCFYRFLVKLFFASTKALSVCRVAGSVYMLIAFCCSTVTKPQGYSPKQSRNIFLCAVNFSFFFRVHKSKNCYGIGRKPCSAGWIRRDYFKWRSLVMSLHFAESFRILIRVRSCRAECGGNKKKKRSRVITPLFACAPVCS